MREEDIYRHLEETFVATFLDELLPGIFHNFANPLNGIMGRSKLMQRRLIDFIEIIKARCPDMDADISDRCIKLLSDVNSIADESDRFYQLFHVSTDKFYALGAHRVDRLNLSRLVESEMGFADFYLDFKHNVPKHVRIDHEIPEISGIRAFYSMAIWALIRQAMKRIGAAKDQTFAISTDHDDRWVSVTVSHVGVDAWPGGQGELSGESISAVNPQDVPDEQKGLFHALLLLKMGGTGVVVRHDANSETLTVSIPRFPDKEEVK